MPVFGPYLIFRLYLSRMQKYAFFPVSPNIPEENPSPARFFYFSARGAYRLSCRRSVEIEENNLNNFDRTGRTPFTTKKEVLA